MTAPTRPRAAGLHVVRHDGTSTGTSHGKTSSDLIWGRAVACRQEWLAHGLATEPADRDAAERSLTRLYAQVLRPAPQFVWVDSPCQALPLLDGLPTLDDLYSWVMAELPFRTAPLAGDIAAGASRLRSALDKNGPDPEPPRKERVKKAVWTTWPAPQALAAGIPLVDVLRHGVQEALSTSLADGFHRPVRAMLSTREHGRTPVPVGWYGQQDAAWIAYYDTLRQLGLTHFTASNEERLDDWASLARTTGWWWPGDRVCVCVDRPSTVDTEPVKGGLHDEVRAVHVGYRDGWEPLGAARPAGNSARNGLRSAA